MSALLAAVGMGLLSAGFSTYSASEQRKAMEAQNKANREAAARNRELAKENAKARKELLLKQFGVSSGKLQDTSQDVLQANGMKLTTLEMDIVKARSVTDNTLATAHITGRLANRMESVIDIKGSMESGNILQSTEADLKDIGNKLEAMYSNVEGDMLNIDVDLANAVNAANNQEILNYRQTQSDLSIGLGALAAGTSSGMSAYSVAK